MEAAGGGTETSFDFPFSFELLLELVVGSFAFVSFFVPVALLKNPYPAPKAANAACPFEVRSIALSKVDLKTCGFKPRSGESYAIRPRMGREEVDIVERSTSEITSPPILSSAELSRIKSSLEGVEGKEAWSSAVSTLSVTEDWIERVRELTNDPTR